MPGSRARRIFVTVICLAPATGLMAIGVPALILMALAFPFGLVFLVTGPLGLAALWTSRLRSEESRDLRLWQVLGLCGGLACGALTLWLFQAGLHAGWGALPLLWTVGAPSALAVTGLVRYARLPDAA